RTQTQIRADMFGPADFSDNTLTAYYNMNETSGTTVPNSAPLTGNSQTGIISGDDGSGSWASSPIEANSNALTFDGIDDQVVIPANTNYDLSTLNGGTIEFWVNPASVSSNFATLLGNRGSGGVRYSFHLSSTQVGVDKCSG